MTSTASAANCVLCRQPATEAFDPPRRTLARGLDPSDPSFSVTVILPDIALCADHFLEVRQGKRLVGWCDNEQCRAYGAIGELSACGLPYETLSPSKRT